MSKLIKEPGIIVAFDMENQIDAIKLARELMFADGNFVIKVGRPLEMACGMSIISQIRNATTVPIIYDGKIADIPYISAKIAEAAYDKGADAVIMHSFVGNDVIEAVVELNRGDVIVVVEMSHPGWPRDLFPYTMVADLRGSGINGIVLPATKPDLIRGISNMMDNDTYIISPGIGAQGAKIGDAVTKGATYEIVGRSIYESDDPVAAAELHYKTMMERFTS